MMDDLNERLRKIENRLTSIEDKLNVQPPNSSKQPPLPPFKPSPQTYVRSSLILWFKENWLVSIGIFLIILAISWFISYAFANDWIRETTRVFFGFISGFIIYSTGLWLLRKQPKGGQALIILGEVIAISVFFAGHQAYSLLPTFSTFLLMLVVVNVTAIIAIKNDLESLGLSSIIFAAMIPMLLNMDSPHSIFLMLYVLIIDIAALWMWTMRGWGKTFHIAWLTTFIYSFSLVTIHDQLSTNLFVWAFYLIFFLSIAFPIYRKKLPSLPLKGTFILLTLNFAFTFWIDYLTPFPWNVISYFIASLMSTVLGYSMVKGWNQIEPKDSTLKDALGTIIGFCAITLLFMATYRFTNHFFLYPISSDATTLLYFIETTAAISIGYFILKSPAVSSYFSLSFIIPLSILWNNPLSILYAPFLSLKFAILCTAAISFLIAAKINRKALLDSEASTPKKFILVWLWIMTSIFAMMLVWNICHQIFPTDSIARGCALVIYIITAEAFIYIGNLKQLKNLRIGGIAMILFVIFQLLAEEVWKMPIVVRMITFIVIGLLLIVTAFFNKKHKR